jgi:plasmid maintenance system antidote protein VapI
MALRLSRYFWTSPDVWIGLQVDYDLNWARMKLQKTIDEIQPLRGKRVA